MPKFFLLSATPGRIIAQDMVLNFLQCRIYTKTNMVFCVFQKPPIQYTPNVVCLNRLKNMWDLKLLLKITSRTQKKEIVCIPVLHYSYVFESFSPLNEVKRDRVEKVEFHIIVIHQTKFYVVCKSSTWKMILLYILNKESKSLLFISFQVLWTVLCT